MTVTDYDITSKKLEGRWGKIKDAEYEWFLGTFSVHKRLPQYRIGYSFDLAPESHLFRRWFERPDLGVKGWAIVFHARNPAGEILVGWVPPERQDEADAWIEFLNSEIRDRLRGKNHPNPATDRGITDDKLRYMLRVAPYSPEYYRLDKRGGDALREDDDHVALGALGTFKVAKHRAFFSIVYREWNPLRSSSRLYKRWFEYPELGDGGVRGWAIIFRIYDPVGEPTEEYESFVGWASPEREKDADRWLDVLNTAISERLRELGPAHETSPAEDRGTEGTTVSTDRKTDEDHIRYMLDGGDRGLIDHLWEMDDAWGFGGSVWLAKEQPVMKFGGPSPSESDEFVPLSSHYQFHATPFHLTDTGTRGTAIWLQTGPRDERSSSLDNRVLCGWVRPEREPDARKWVAFLNGLMASHLARRQAEWDALTDDQRAEATNAARFEESVRFFERMGVPMPTPENKK